MNTFLVRSLLLSGLITMTISAFSQQAPALSIFDGRSWGVVLEHPDMKNVVLKNDVTYLNNANGTLKMDVYLPPDIKPNEKRAAVIFLNAMGDYPGEIKPKNWATYTSWPRLVAANGMIGISMECDRNHVQESIAGIFSFIDGSGAEYNIDKERLGVYAASANVTQSLIYLMKPDAYKGIKAAALYYGNYSEGPYRKDLPVLFVISEGDVRGDRYLTIWNEVMKNKAPWTIQMGSGLIHAFDSFTDTDDSRKVIKETISFWKNHLDPIPPHTWPNSIGREVLAAQYGQDPEKAAGLIKKWVDQHPEDNDALFRYGDFLKHLKRYGEAEEVLKKVLAREPDHVEAQTDMIITLYSLKRDTEAQKYLAKAMKSGALKKNSYSNIGMALYTLGNHKEGIKLFEKTVEMGPIGTDFYNLACGYAVLNEKDKAFAALNKSIELGFNSKQQFENDTDLNSLRSDKRYQDLVPRLK